jgi:hypothetical protein
VLRENVVRNAASICGGKAPSNNNNNIEKHLGCHQRNNLENTVSSNAIGKRRETMTIKNQQCHHMC